MKASLLLSVLFISLLSSCGGEDPIFYIGVPKSGFSGDNILHEEITVLDSTKDYSMIVQLDRDMAYKVILRNKSIKLPVNLKDSLASVWKVKSAFKNNGWFVYDYNFKEQSQTFITEGPVSAHLALDFNGCGKMDLEIYENGNKRLTSTKQVSWEDFCDP